MSVQWMRRWIRQEVGWCCAALLLAACQGAAAPAITSFTLMDADSDQPVPGYDPLTNGAVINLTLPNMASLSIRANGDPAGDFGSVRFVLTGATSHTRTENTPPWALNGDNSGDYNAFTFNEGEHTLTATPYPQDGTGGTAGTGLTINFTVIRSNLPPTEPPAAVQVALIAPEAGARFVAPATISLAASVVSTSGAVARVEFLAGNHWLGEASAPPLHMALEQRGCRGLRPDRTGVDDQRRGWNLGAGGHHRRFGKRNQRRRDKRGAETLASGDPDL